MTGKGTEAGADDAAAAATAAAEAAQAAVEKAAETESAKDLKAAQSAIATLQEKVTWLETEAKKPAPQSEASELKASLAEAKSLLAEMRETLATLKQSIQNAPPPIFASASDHSGERNPVTPKAGANPDPPPIPPPRMEGTPMEPRESAAPTPREERAAPVPPKKKIRLL